MPQSCHSQTLTNRTRLKGAGGKDNLKGGGGKDVCIGGKANDSAFKCEVEKSI